jgi:hypothetical protein
MPPKLNRKRALFVLTKIDEILAWEFPVPKFQSAVIRQKSFDSADVILSRASIGPVQGG